MQLEKLQEFKLPFTKLWEEFICSYSVVDISDGSNCEFFLIGANDENYENIDEELTQTVEKLARLLHLKEESLKANVLNYDNKRTHSKSR